MSTDILLSLCVPTNGVIEWVIPVIDSIYLEKAPVGKFEVIVTDNGKNAEFAALMEKYQNKFDNLIYKQTEAIQFHNQIEAFKLARGKLIKFINHRMMLLPGALNYLIKYSKDNDGDKPTTYFSNGVLKIPNCMKTNNFDQFVRNLSYFSSWSAGTAMWKNDFEKMDTKKPFNKYFPHIDMVFFNKTGDNYKIDNRVLMKEIQVDDTQKGRYDLFDAFAYEYIKVIEDLYKDGFITKETFEYVKKENKGFVADLYYKYVIKKKPCSYNIDGFNRENNYYYSRKELVMLFPKFALGGLYRKIVKKR